MTQSRTRIKFCGLTRADDVARAVALGVDAIGLVLAERSIRSLTVDEARSLRRQLPPFVSAVVLTMDAAVAQVRHIVQIARPDCLQFHGSENEPDCAAHGLPYLKAVPMAQPAAAPAVIARYPGAVGFVLDAHASGEVGGQGRKFDWSTVPETGGRALVLAGGLTPDNVFDAICQVRPFAVDVASGIEQAPGHKCPARMARFVAEVRRADAVLNSQDADHR